MPKELLQVGFFFTDIGRRFGAAIASREFAVAIAVATLRPAKRLYLLANIGFKLLQPLSHAGIIDFPVPVGVLDVVPIYIQQFLKTL